MGWFRQRLVGALSPLMRTGPARAAARALLPTAERFVFRLTRGRGQLSSILVPSLMLQTVGARTGLLRETALMCFPVDGGWIVVGSNFGDDAHPAWTTNLLAEPAAKVRFRGRTWRVRALPITGEAREALWPRLERQWPGYRAYEVTAGRELRMFRLERESPR